MIKILQVVGNLRIGGAETVAMNILRYIDKNKYEVHYLVYSEKISEFEEEVKELGGKVIHVPYTSNIFRYIQMLHRLNKEYGPYSIIHSHMMFHNGIVLSAAKILGITGRISHSHSTNEGGKTNNIFQYLIRKIYVKFSRNLIVHNSTTYIGCGLAAGNFLYGKKLFAKEGKYIRNGIDINRYIFDQSIRQKLREKYGLSDNIRAFACIGHFDIVKNHAFIIDVFDDVCKYSDNFRLFLLGEGKLRPEIEALVEAKHLKEKILFTGNVTNVHEWLQAIDCLLMPSLYEGVPLTLIEAQASGLKCLVSSNVSQESAITSCIEFIPLECKKKWIDRMCNIDNYKRHSMIEEISRSGYNVADRMNDIFDIYSELC